jgi:hypothetical protein
MIDYKTLVQEDRIHASLYTDPQVFDDDGADLPPRGFCRHFRTVMTET